MYIYIYISNRSNQKSIHFRFGKNLKTQHFKSKSSVNQIMYNHNNLVKYTITLLIVKYFSSLKLRYDLSPFSVSQYCIKTKKFEENITLILIRLSDIVIFVNSIPQHVYTIAVLLQWLHPIFQSSVNDRTPFRLTYKPSGELL